MRFTMSNSHTAALHCWCLDMGRQPSSNYGTIRAVAQKCTYRFIGTRAFCHAWTSLSLSLSLSMWVILILWSYYCICTSFWVPLNQYRLSEVIIIPLKHTIPIKSCRFACIRVFRSPGVAVVEIFEIKCVDMVHNVAINILFFFLSFSRILSLRNRFDFRSSIPSILYFEWLFHKCPGNVATVLSLLSLLPIELISISIDLPFTNSNAVPSHLV